MAKLLEDDIQRRGLREGDRCLTNKQAAGILQVSEVTAHRAMQVLAGQNKITIAMSPGQEVLSRIADLEPPAYVRAPGIRARKDMLPEGFKMNLGPRVRFAGDKAFLLCQERLYRYPEGASKWERVYTERN